MSVLPPNWPRTPRGVWESATLMSWISMGIRAGGFLLVLPALAARLPKSDIELWLLFSTATGLVLMLCFGFDSTLVRLIAYALAGRPIAEMGDMAARWEKSTGVPDTGALRRVLRFLARVFARVGVIGFLVAAVVGSAVLWRSVERSSSPAGGWWAWAMVCLGCGSALYGMRFACILQGFNRVAELRRWEAVFGIGAVAITLAVVMLKPSLPVVVTTWQAIGVLGVLRNRWLAMSIPEVRAAAREPTEADPELWALVWPVSWRMGVTILGSLGLIQASGIIYSLLPNPTQLAGYLLCLRLYQFLYSIGGVPFHARIPALAGLRASGDIVAQMDLARKVMRRVYVTVILGICGVAVLGNYLLDAGRSGEHLDLKVWWVLGVALVVQLYGGMLGGLYGLSNRVFGHHAILVFGSSYYGSALLLVPPLGAQGIAWALLLGCSVAAAFAAWKTYPALRVAAWTFERGVTVPAVATIVLLAAAGRAIAK